MSWVGWLGELGGLVWLVGWLGGLDGLGNPPNLPNPSNPPNPPNPTNLPNQPTNPTNLPNSPNKPTQPNQPTNPTNRFYIPNLKYLGQVHVLQCCRTAADLLLTCCRAAAESPRDAISAHNKMLKCTSVTRRKFWAKGDSHSMFYLSARRFHSSTNTCITWCVLFMMLLRENT